MPWQKRVADGLTASRAVLALLVLWTAVSLGPAGAEMVLILLLVAATGDTLDGYLARRSGSEGQTWIGEHDVWFDIFFTTCLLLFLVVAQLAPPVLATGHFVGWMWLFHRQHSAPNSYAVLYQAPVYLGVVVAAIACRPRALTWVIGWLGVMGLFAWRRFFGVRVPAFVRDLREHVVRR
ncbi:MAG TPA: CDP-alcohol phosphatidyltransferase family protein [Aggregatilinea sp.]|uniref:CDP-alcohol phosphatidyltransferase family protein n=1 Tax=Aggregatilinea sp. TaxID=2806333 RepID=UPI002C086B20|nr:CDP-alcohol phosphatidyltransferase family protein [Aggregatilinea sp.]HML20778.1 CDP-alcohol phosphatidyltransferase family protein [Aggregatilinea sp.]